MAQLWLGSRYRLVKVLGSGGAAMVWRAWDERMRRYVAVKVLKDTFGVANSDRFGLEAVLAGGLSSPNIVVVHDRGKKVMERRAGPAEPADAQPYGPATRVLTPHDELPATLDPQATSVLGPVLGGHQEPDGTVMYVAMELITGRSMAQLVADGAWLPIPLVVGWAIQLCDGLDVAHSGGVLHRDIKTANVMVGSRGVVKILDFGIARYMETLSSRAGITLPGSMLGTPAYMSPEQIRGGEIDGRADLYSVGCVLHELLTGAPPFGLDHPHALLHRHLTIPPESVRNTRLEVPDDLASLVLELLGKRPASRPATAAEVRDRLCELSIKAPRDLAPQPWGAGEPEPAESVTAADTQDQPVRLLPPPRPEPERARAADSVHMVRVELGRHMRVYGPDHPETLLLREQLANRLGRDGDVDAALALLRAVISDSGRLRGALDPGTLRARRALARWTAESGRADVAAHLLKGLLPDQVQVLGTDHTETLRVRRELARREGDSGNHEGAVRLLRALVPDVIRVLGPEHDLVTEVWDELTSWEHRLDRARLRDQA